MRIDILVPSRGRPAKLAAMTESAFSRSRYPGLIGVEAYLDEDDPFGATYIRLPERRYRYRMGPAEGVAAAWNALARDSTADIVMIGNDDLVFETEGWDESVRYAMGDWPDRIGVVFCSDGINGDRHAAFPFVHRNWLRAVGHLTGATRENGFAFFYNDTWVFDVARRVGRVRYLPFVSIRHDHFTVTGEKDETTERNRRSGQCAQDAQAWESSAALRERDAERLREAIRCASVS